MESVGIVRKVDKLGRITLAKEDRKILGINGLDPVEMVREGEEIIIKKYNKDSCCTICSKKIEGDKSLKVEKKIICLDCVSKIERISKK